MWATDFDKELFFLTTGSRTPKSGLRLATFFKHGPAPQIPSWLHVPLLSLHRVSVSSLVPPIVLCKLTLKNSRRWHSRFRIPQRIT